MWLLYNLLFTLLAPIWVPWMMYRSWKRKEQPNWQERQGNFEIPKPGKRKRIWIHTVSVGEFVASKPILKELRKTLPNHEILVSVTTSSGHATAREAEKGLYDYLVYFPVDIPRFQLAAMQRVQPDVVAIMETELWMNFLWAAKALGAKTALLNGRISDRSYPRYKLLKFFMGPLLAKLDRVMVQTEVDAERLTSLGAKNAEVLGNAKFDQAVEGLEADPTVWRKKLGLPADKPVLVIGSTRGEEEERLVIDAIRKFGLDRLSVVHAPRHIERAPALAEAVQAAFGSVALRSKGVTGPYLILDTYGELAKVYSVADIVIVGGGFMDLGGQNIIQPLAHGKPVIHGPHMQNFREAAEMARKAGVAITAADPDAIADALELLVGNPEIRQRMGAAARELIQQHLGASRRYAQAIADLAKK